MKLSTACRVAESLLTQLPSRWAHSCQVLEQARRLAPVLGADTELLSVAAVLHDVGYARAAVDTGQHMIDGARFLDRLGVDPTVCSLVAYHSSSEWEASELGLSAELAKFLRPPSELLDAITYCDLTSGPDGTEVDPVSRLDEVLRRYGPTHVVHRAVSTARPALLAMVERTKKRIAESDRS
ncbi:metal-dependent phosphohydrolase, HD subdomain protein [Kitasatospora xanthocidica]|uniref:HD domain-containing protein n=1 Tax=Kitasatospora xanthocidica TaxID=83382 RepID=UPI0016739075|nr:HD domain-containing protein [Kitasatospora xanthocidica]GHF77051.1 metal-dependent phosphohydrolase, HD subdomain protein [Kitasatospora xanthocidica]